MLGERLIVLRQARSLEQGELARMAGIPAPTLNRIELGRRANPLCESVCKIAIALRLTPVEFTALVCPDLIDLDRAA